MVRLKRRDGLYRDEDFGVVFVGSNLFRATIELPANVTVGPMDARVFLFREGKLLSQFETRVNLQREGAGGIPAHVCLFVSVLLRHLHGDYFCCCWFVRVGVLRSLSTLVHHPTIPSLWQSDEIASISKL